MKYLIIGLITLLFSTLTLLSGFGLGTVLMPVFALFFPLPLAIGGTAVVHLMNSLFQVSLVGNYANYSIVWRFGLPAILASFVGASLLSLFSNFEPIFSQQVGRLEINITVTGLIVGMMVIISSLFELTSRAKSISFHSKYIPLGGLLSGFFGGLAGYQGALRSAFLINAGLNTKQFIGTSAVCSVLVDMARLLIYSFSAYKGDFGELKTILPLLVMACLTSLLGSYLGSKLMHKIAFRSLQLLVGSMLFVLGFAIILGIGKR